METSGRPTCQTSCLYQKRTVCLKFRAMPPDYFKVHYMVKQGPLDTTIGGSTEGILGFVYVEFQFFGARDSSHQSFQSAKSGCVEKTAMF